MAKKPGPIHDKFANYWGDEPDSMSLFFREHLPKSLSSRIGTELPELIKGKFVDERIEQHQTDILYKVKLTNGRNGFVYILTDHKSSPDYDIALQLHRYMSRIWEKHTKQDDWRPLPVIWPIVLYHGIKNWTVPRNFAALYGKDQDEEVSNILDFEYHLVDLSQIPDDELSSNQRIRVFLTVQKHILRSDFIEAINTVLTELKFLGELDITAILNYILLKHGHEMDRSIIEGVLVDIESSKKERIMTGITQEWWEEGKQKGIIEGKIEGIEIGVVKGEIKLLMRLLERRFGSLSNDLKDRVTKADADTVELWGDRVLDASSLDDVFKGIS